MSMRVCGTVALAIAALGCAADVELVATIEVGAEHRLIPPSSLGPRFPSIGMNDDGILVSWSEDITDPEVFFRPNPMIWRRYARWFSATGDSLGEAISLGPTMANLEQWVLDGDALVAQMWGDPLDRIPQVSDDQRVFSLRMTAPDLFEAEQVYVPMAPLDSLCAECTRLAITSNGPTGLGVLPTVVGGAVVSILASAPQGCGKFVSPHRMFAFAHADRYRASLLVWDDRCGPDGRSLEVGNYYAVRLASGDVGVLFRWDYSPYRLNDIHYLVLSADTLQPIAPPVPVGNGQSLDGLDGFQPRAAVAPDGHILFTQLSESGGNHCHYIRVMDADGAAPHDAPWQLPCLREGTDRHRTRYPELLAIEGLGVLLIWDQRSMPNTADLDDEIYAVLLTGTGHRGSEIVRVTSDAASAGGPTGAGFRPFAAAHHGRAVVGWLDAREDAPGIRVRFLDVAELSE